jgi:hypothetical protein
MTSTEDIALNEAGDYVSYATMVLEAPGRLPVTMKDRINGTWQLDDGILSNHVLHATILSTSDPSVTIESAQNAEDAQLRKKSTFQNRIFDYTRERYRTIAINSMYKEAEVESSCDRI